MAKICLKHRDNPARIYGECVGCEIDSLRAERDLFKKETVSLAKDALRYQSALEQIANTMWTGHVRDFATLRLQDIAKEALEI